MNKGVSLSAIQTFTTVAQAQSFSRAAELLHITPSAISHQMKLLESQLGVKLFYRKSKGVQLSMAGETLLRHAASGIRDIQHGIQQSLFASQKSKLVIAAIPSLCQMWLLPRLTEFYAKYPQIEIELIALDQIADFSLQHCDAHIHFGSGDYKGLEAKFLAHETIYPVCHPDLIEEPKTQSLERIIEYTGLLHYNAGVEDAPGGISWADWTPALTIDKLGGLNQMWFSHVSMAVAAAKLKQGVALGWHHMILDDLNSGKLCRLTEETMKTLFGYNLVAPPIAWKDEPLNLFADWLKLQFDDCSNESDTCD